MSITLGAATSALLGAGNIMTAATYRSLLPVYTSQLKGNSSGKHHEHPAQHKSTNKKSKNTIEGFARNPEKAYSINRVMFAKKVRQVLREKFEETIEKVVSACKAVYGPELVTVAVYGSVGRGTPNPYSDIDLLIVASELPHGRLARARQFEEVERRVQTWLERMRKDHGIHTCLSPVIKTPEEVLKGSWLFLDMIDDARILFDKNGFFADYLRRLVERLRDMGAQKIFEGQRWHWVLKPDYRPGEVFDL